MKIQKREINKNGDTVFIPLVRIGTFGIHILKNPAGSYSFVGTIPQNLAGIVFASENDAIDALIKTGEYTNIIFEEIKGEIK